MKMSRFVLWLFLMAACGVRGEGFTIHVQNLSSQDATIAGLANGYVQQFLGSFDDPQLLPFVPPGSTMEVSIDSQIWVLGSDGTYALATVTCCMIGSIQAPFSFLPGVSEYDAVLSGPGDLSAPHYNLAFDVSSRNLLLVTSVYYYLRATNSSLFTESFSLSRQWTNTSTGSMFGDTPGVEECGFVGPASIVPYSGGSTITRLEEHTSE